LQLIKQEVEYLTRRFETELHELIEVRSKIMEFLKDEKIDNEYTNKISTRIHNAIESFKNEIDFIE
jgi:hypothetical protein